jgi:hypothetical protein
MTSKKYKAKQKKKYAAVLEKTGVGYAQDYIKAVDEKKKKKMEAENK